mmetsp:Transcript_5035/g.9270  ORF Transcript_5035/g.9270 Transcript_5035/m.9270 type:complete len:225 (+) Transcript_5035:3636-4310(+)|eukprot:CAMPEP_0197520532 /NCGR_PEP_ID=MMETSP1318-20131121/5877_1 /TAXON_ID=552666 /ORGANISM="Partenskyella glossopodia, Strain RCC365" /LENGTH=224 /DNA_ID=CAMNT_0043072161 /DNA_START=85 /DNA_END=759 /DNA_ORIENTATION=-
MFQKFDASKDIRSHTQVKGSIARNIKKEVKKLYPQLDEVIDHIFPKKNPVYLVKCHQIVTVVESRDFWWFYRVRNGPLIPTLKMLHKFPSLLPSVTVDKGAIKHVLKGSKIMSPGLTSKGGSIEGDLKEGEAVAVMAEGMKHAIAVGTLVMSADEIRATNKGIAIDFLLYLNDGLWQASQPKQDTAETKQRQPTTAKKTGNADENAADDDAKENEEVIFDDDDL